MNLLVVPHPGKRVQAGRPEGEQSSRGSIERPPVRAGVHPARAECPTLAFFFGLAAGMPSASMTSADAAPGTRITSSR